MTGFIFCVVLYLLIFAVCIWRPNTGRILLGIGFLLMAYGVNGTTIATDATGFVKLGEASFLPLYRPLFTDVVGASPIFWGLVVIVYETAVGLLILSRGRRTKAGLIMAIIFLVGITPFGVETLSSPLLALACQYLLAREFPQSLPDMLRGLRPAHR